MTARRAALYASETTIAKYLGRREEGTWDLMGSKRSLNHLAGVAKFGRSQVCLLLVSTSLRSEIE